MSTRIRRAIHGAILLHSTAAALAIAAASPAWAADEAAGAPDDGAIVVTARRREENTQDVPISISVVSAKTLERTGNYTLNQLQQQVPTLQITSINPRNTNISIRGLGANSSVAVDGLEYGVGFYVDGVYYGRPGQSQFDIVDLQQVEVLNGPQGTLFGKNTTAGAINITTREPSFTPELTAEAHLGDFDFRQIRVSGSDLPPAEWPRYYVTLDHECRARSTSRKRLSASCVKLRLCWRRAPRPLKRAAASRSANRPIIAGARNMAA